MPALELSVLFAGIALLALGSIGGSLLRILPATRRLRAQLAACPDRLELRYTIRETVAVWNDGTVVALPLRPRRARPVQPGALRAAA